jgi:hypothetical protein
LSKWDFVIILSPLLEHTRPPGAKSYLAMTISELLSLLLSSFLFIPFAKGSTQPIVTARIISTIPLKPFYRVTNKSGFSRMERSGKNFLAN